MDLFTQLTHSLFRSAHGLFIPLLILIIVGGGLLFFRAKGYRESSYRRLTGESFLSVWTDKGKYGEYLTYDALKEFEKEGAKFLFNLYIPKKNGETTEIDLMMISRKGIFVFESKNYGGWIFGRESQRNWTQVLPSGNGTRKESFYNPIMQNRTHIRDLVAFIGEEYPTRSIIVFSERCELKEIDVESADIRVVKRDELRRAVLDVYERETQDLLSPSQIETVYQLLRPLTQVGDDVKARHIENIRKRLEENADLSGAEGSQSAATQSKKSQLKSSGEAQRVCPQCGGTLVLRTAKRGANAGAQFWGCGNYPKCRYTEDKE
ncbi:MAG: NERD domain-containing protein [Thermoguttaceae bacterium]